MSTNSLCFLTVLSEMCVKSANLKVCSHWQLEVAPSALLLVDCMSSSLTSLSILLWGGYSCYTGSCHIVSLCIYIKLNSFVALPNAVSNSHSNWMILVALSANQCQYKCTLWKQFITFFFGLFPTMGIVDFLKLSLKTLSSLYNSSTNNVQQQVIVIVLSESPENVSTTVYYPPHLKWCTVMYSILRLKWQWCKLNF